MEITLLHNNESYLLDILIKLGFIGGMYKVWSEISQNGMLRKDLHIDSILCYMKKLVNLINFIVQVPFIFL